MNRTKTLTQGAMLLAIFGALVLIDRITTYWLTTFVVLIAPIIIIMYSAMQSLKDGLFLSIGIVIISFLLGNFNTTYLIYVPVGIVTGLIYSFAMYKGLDKRMLMFLAVITYLVCEVIAYYVVYPLLGFPVSQMIDSYKQAINEAGTLSGYDYESAMAAAGLSLDKFIPIMYLISTMITGAIEGFLIHFFTIFLLKRFKIKDLGTFNLWESKPNKVLSYVSFISIFALFLRDYITNETLYYAVMVVGILGAVVLLYYGYIFVLLYGRIVLHKNLSFIFIALTIFFPIMLVFAVCVGFLYGAGTLRAYLENKINNINNNNNE